MQEDTKQISDNDFNALNLCREREQLRNELREKASHTMNSYSDPRVNEISDRIHSINYALEAWAKGEDILVAMLRDPREERDTRAEQYEQVRAQLTAKIYQTTVALQKMIFVDTDENGGAA